VASHAAIFPSLWAALNEHRTRLPSDLTGDLRPAASFRPYLHDSAAPTAQIIQLCARCLDAKLALPAAQIGVTRAGPDQFQITERDWVSLGVPPDRRI